MRDVLMSARVIRIVALTLTDENASSFCMICFRAFLSARKLGSEILFFWPSAELNLFKVSRNLM
jgi:hypothetical protein